MIRPELSSTAHFRIQGAQHERDEGWANGQRTKILLSNKGFEERKKKLQKKKAIFLVRNSTRALQSSLVPNSGGVT